MSELRRNSTEVMAYIADRLAAADRPTYQELAQDCDQCFGTDFGTGESVRKFAKRRRLRPQVDLAAHVDRERQEIVERSERRELSRQLKERARADILKDAITAAILQLPELEPVRYEAPPAAASFEEEHMVLDLSDLHVGYWLTKEASGGLWSYDFETFRTYIRRIVQKVRIIVPRHNYRLPVLHIHGLGDWVENQIMRPGQAYEIEFGLVRQVIMAAQEIAWMVRELLTMFERIEITVLPGNHGRMTQKPGELPAGESFDLIVGEFLRAYLATEPRVSVRVVDAKRTVVEVLGWRIMLAHGDGIRGWAGIPHYGRDRHNLNVSALYEDLSEGIDVITLGHHHDPHDGTFRTWGRYLANGSFTGATNYSIEKLNRATQPAQWLYGVSRERPISWQYLLTLADRPPKRRAQVS